MELCSAAAVLGRSCPAPNAEKAVVLAVTAKERRIKDRAGKSQRNLGLEPGMGVS
jgi:hypothetical protein